MKRYITASSEEKLDVYCDNVGELMNVLKKISPDSSICYTDGRSLHKATVRVHEETKLTDSGYKSKQICIDVVDF